MSQVISLRCKNCGYNIEPDLISGRCHCEACDSDFLLQDYSGASQNYEIIAGELKQYKGSSPIIVIPPEVTSLGNGCFSSLESIESVSLPEGLYKIGDGAFQNCTRLKYVSLPNSLESIGRAAFKNCGLIDLTIPESIKTIAAEAFMDCKNLKKVSLPKKIIPYEKTFKHCTDLSSIDFDLSDFCLSFKSSLDAIKRGDTRPTLGDAFQGTKYYMDALTKMKHKQCIVCGGKIKKY